MSSKNGMLKFTLIIFFKGLIAMITPISAIEWDELTSHQKHIVTFVMPEARSSMMKEEDVDAFLLKHGTRSGIYHSVGMLYRNAGADQKNAQLIMRRLLDLQHNVPGEDLHGMWRTGLNSDRKDQNWREFVGTGFIVARANFGNVLDPDLVQGIDVALVRASEGALQRNVSPGYTNIALMSAFLLDYTGHLVSNDVFINAGQSKAKAIRDLFFEHQTFTEFNSPTYYGTNLMALGMWRELAQSEDLRLWAQEIEAVFWNHIAQFYHAGLKNMCGPYVRGYGMDMTEYNALVGMCIGLGLDNWEQTPLPNTKDRAFEWAYAPVFALLNVHPPKDLLPQFKHFTQPREILDHIAYRKKVFQAQAVLEPTWMMGAATGMRRRWDQHCPGTVHWQAGDHTGWLLVAGENAAEVKIEDRKLHIYLTEPDVNIPLRILLHVPNADLERINDKIWDLPGMTFHIETSLATPSVEVKTDKRFGDVIEVAFPVSQSQSIDKPLLVISPFKKE